MIMFEQNHTDTHESFVNFKKKPASNVGVHTACSARKKRVGVGKQNF